VKHNSSTGTDYYIDDPLPGHWVR